MPSLGMFFLQKFGHIDVEIGIFMRGIRLIWIMAAEMAKSQSKIFSRANDRLILMTT